MKVVLDDDGRQLLMAQIPGTVVVVVGGRAEKVLPLHS